MSPHDLQCNLPIVEVLPNSLHVDISGYMHIYHIDESGSEFSLESFDGNLDGPAASV